MVSDVGSMGAGVMTTVASYLGPVTVGAHHVVQSTYMFFCTCGDAVSQAAQSFLPGKVGHFALHLQHAAFEENFGVVQR